MNHSAAKGKIHLIVLGDVALPCFRPLRWPVATAGGPSRVLPPLHVWSFQQGYVALVRCVARDLRP